MNISENIITAVDLPTYQVKEAPHSVYYVPNFINEVEEDWILDKVGKAPKPKWTQLLNRRLQNWGGIPSSKGLIVEPLPEWLQNFVGKVNNLNIYDNGKLKANHVLVNEYLPGQGIMPHEDGPLFYPTIATISCGSHTVLQFVRKSSSDMERNSDSKPCSLLLERRSLIIVKDEMYKNYTHEIKEITEDILDENIKNLSATKSKLKDCLMRDTRISLTIRHVPNTCKIQLKNLLR